MNDISHWAGTPQGQQVRERTATYTDADWRAFRAELSTIHLKILAAMRAGTPPGDPAVMDLVEEHRSHVSPGSTTATTRRTGSLPTST
jgi:hypothetical protein